MLIRCYFTIIVMVDTIYSASSQNSLKFPPTFGTIHHVLLQHLDFYSNHATLFPAQIQVGIHEIFILASFCALYTYVHASLFGLLVSTFDQFQSFYLVEFTMDLHPYDIEHQDITSHDNCHAHMHGLIHDTQLRACQSCLQN